jgi:hypothetical protein
MMLRWSWNDTEGGLAEAAEKIILGYASSVCAIRGSPTPTRPRSNG